MDSDQSGQSKSEFYYLEEEAFNQTKSYPSFLSLFPNLEREISEQKQNKQKEKLFASLRLIGLERPRSSAIFN